MNQDNYENDLIKYGNNQTWQISINDMMIDCEATRNFSGCWCGYVFYGNHNRTIDNVDDIEVHGGVTFINGNKIGFDCNHWDDYAPLGTYTFENTKYRDFGFVKRETEKLAKQVFLHK